MYKLETLANKTKILLAPQKATDAVTILALVKVGSRHEAAPVNGISHFIEHLLFKGTTSRPTSLDISKELDGVGADFNAFTGKDHTGYYVKVSHDKLALALNIVSDMLFNSLFDQQEIAKERGVIIEEINMYDDNPLISIGNLFEEVIFKGSSLGNDIAGPKKNIREISRRQITDYFWNHYRSDNILVGVGGNFDLASARRLIKKYFSAPGGNVKKSRFKKFAAAQTKLRIKVKYKATEQVQVALGFPAYRAGDPRNYGLTLLSVILGGNMSSRLFIEIREKLGLAYHIRSGIITYEDTGALEVFAGLDKAKVALALKTIRRELESFAQGQITDDELRRAKEFVKGKLTLSLEDSAAHIQWLAEQQLLQGRIETLAFKLKKIDQVSVKQIKKVALEVIKKNKYNVAVIGPYRSASSFLNIFK